MLVMMRDARVVAQERAVGLVRLDNANAAGARVAASHRALARRTRARRPRSSRRFPRRAARAPSWPTWWSCRASPQRQRALALERPHERLRAMQHVECRAPARARVRDCRRASPWRSPRRRRPSTSEASCPTRTSMPASRKAKKYRLSPRSLPVTATPCAATRRATADIPEPPTPMKCHLMRAPPLRDPRAAPRRRRCRPSPRPPASPRPRPRREHALRREFNHARR